MGTAWCIEEVTGSMKEAAVEGRQHCECHCKTLVSMRYKEEDGFGTSRIPERVMKETASF